MLRRPNRLLPSAYIPNPHLNSTSRTPSTARIPEWFIPSMTRRLLPVLGLLGCPYVHKAPDRFSPFWDPLPVCQPHPEYSKAKDLSATKAPRPRGIFNTAVVFPVRGGHTPDIARYMISVTPPLTINITDSCHYSKTLR